MSITEMMNYRYNNPDVEVEVDTKIAEKFASRERETENIDSFEAWANVSKEASKIETIISAYKQQSIGNTINVKR